MSKILSSAKSAVHSITTAVPFAEAMATRESRRVMLDGELDLLMKVWSGELIVGKNGVKFKGLWYGQYDARLLAYQGRKVKISYDPNAIETVYVYEAATLKLITIAEQARLILYGTSVGESALREAMANKRRSLRVVRDYGKAARVAHTDLASLAREAAIDAQNDRLTEEPQTAPTVKLAKTALSGRPADKNRLKRARAMKKAAGAEGIRQVIDLELDQIKVERDKREVFDFGLFDF